MTDTIVVSFDEFRRITGRRFRLTPEESGRVKSGEATREQILQERFDAGLEPKQKTEDFWNDPRLTLDNFKEIAGRRFRRPHRSPHQGSQGRTQPCARISKPRVRR